MDRKSLAGWAVEATSPPLEIRWRERWSIRWNAIRDRVRYRRIPVGKATGWTQTLNARYAGIAIALRNRLEEREDALEKERAALRAQLGEPPAALRSAPPRPEGTARQRHDWALERRAELRLQAAQRASTAARQAAAVRLAIVQTELDQIQGEFQTLAALCESAYLIRVEMYNRTRCARTDRKVTDVSAGPPYDGPGWRCRRPHLDSVHTRSA